MTSLYGSANARMLAGRWRVWLAVFCMGAVAGLALASSSAAGTPQQTSFRIGVASCLASNWTVSQPLGAVICYARIHGKLESIDLVVNGWVITPKHTGGIIPASYPSRPSWRGGPFVCVAAAGGVSCTAHGHGFRISSRGISTQ